MQIQVIPIRRLPLAIPHLDYLVGFDLVEKIRPGQLVSIPFRGKDEFGLVKAIGKSEKVDSAKLKPINSIVFPEPLIPQELVGFYSELSEFYRAPIGFILKTSLLPMQKKILPKLAGSIKPLPKRTLALPAKPVLHNYSATLERDKIIIQISGRKGQRLILCPEVGQPEEIKTILPPTISKNAIIVKGDAGAREYSNIWTMVRSNPELFVIGTRKALFLPWINLTSIVIYDEGNSDYKSWDMTPRFHARDAALMLAKFTGARLHFVTGAPSVETYYFAENKIYESEGRLEKITKPSPIFVNLKSEQRAGHFGALSMEVLDKIRQCRGDVFVHVSRRLTACGVTCRDCGRIFNCGACGRPMSFYQKDGLLHCCFCKITAPLPSACPTCQSVDYRMFGAGTDGVAEEIRKSLGAAANIIVMDKLAPSAFEKLASKEQKIIVGTDFAWPHLDWRSIKLFVMSDPDIALALPEYKVTEEIWQKLRRAELSLPQDSTFYIQTSIPDHPVFRGLFDPHGYYLAELNGRKAFGYPPFNYLVRLYFGATSKASAENESKRLFDHLAALTKSAPDVKISGPIPANPPFWRGLNWQVLLLKFNYKNYKKRAREILANIPESWKVDPNPNNILSIS